MGSGSQVFLFLFLASYQIVSELVKTALLYKLLCFIRNYKRELQTHRTAIFFLGVFYIGNQLLTRHMPLAPLYQVDERIAKRSGQRFLGAVLFV